MYQLLIFDLDGTLLDSKQDIVLSTNAILKQQNLAQLPAEVIESYVGSGVGELIRGCLLSSLQNQDQVEKYIAPSLELFQNYFLDHCLDYSDWYPGVAENLSWLKQNFQLAILTNKPRIFTEKTLGGLKGGHLFDWVISIDDGFPKKPDPQGGQFILNQAQCSHKQALYIGDSEVDWQTAHNLKMDMVFMEYGFGELSLEEKGQTKKCLGSFNELMEWLKLI